MEGSGRTLTAVDEDGHVRAEISSNGTVRSLVTCVRDNSTILGVLYYDGESRSTVIKNVFEGTEIGIINGDNTVLVYVFYWSRPNPSPFIFSFFSHYRKEMVFVLESSTKATSSSTGVEKFSLGSTQLLEKSPMSALIQ